MNKSVAVAAFVALALSACGDGQNVASADNPTTSAESPSTQASPTWPTGPTCDGKPAVSRAEELDWADFIFMNGRHYYAQGPSKQPLALGPAVGRVRCQLINSGTQSEYKPVNGDAAGQAAGTLIYEVAGQPVTSMLATKEDNGIWTWLPEKDNRG